MKLIRFTKEGFEKAKKEFEELTKQRPAVIEDIQKAREMGDLKENGYYQASRAKLSFIDGRLFKLEMDMKHGVIVENDESSGISIGNTVTLLYGDREIVFTIVGDLETNPEERKISLLSPLGKALEGKKIGQEARIELPRGTTVYKIISVT